MGNEQPKSVEMDRKLDIQLQTVEESKHENESDGSDVKGS